MISLELSNHQILAVNEKFDPMVRQHKRVCTPIAYIEDRLTSFVEIGDNFTFGDLLGFVTKAPAFYECVFKTIMGDFPIKPIIEESKKEPGEVGYKTVEIYWEAEIDEYEGKIFDLTPAIHGVEGNEHYGLDFTPICSLMPLQLKLNPRVELLTAPKPTYLGDKGFTLYDILYAILYEVTFCGTPQMRTKQLAELDRRVAGIRDSKP